MTELLTDWELESTLWHILVTGEMPVGDLRALSLSLDDAERVKLLKDFMQSQKQAHADMVIGEDRMIPDGARSAGKTYAVFGNKLRAEMRTRNRGEHD